MGSLFVIADPPEESQTLRWHRFRRCGSPRRGPNATLAAFSTLRRCPKQSKRYAGSVFDVAEAPQAAQTLRWQRCRRCGGDPSSPNVTLAAFSTSPNRPKKPERYAGSVFDGFAPLARPPERAQKGSLPTRGLKKVTFQINFKRRIYFFGSPDFSIFWNAWPRYRNVA